LDPIYRLVKRAEDYREDEDVLFAVRKEDNELNQLSKALNQMLLRISKDKEKLRLTVQSLENANLDLKQAQREILQAEKLASVGRLSSGIAHEIGNPIGIIMGYLDLLKKSDITRKERDEYINRTEAELNRVNTTIRQLLDFSRPPSDGIKSVHVHEVIDELTAVVKYQPFMTNISLNLKLDAPTDIVRADANQLRQVFLNLMINAADAITSGNNSTNGLLTIESAVLPKSPMSNDEPPQPPPLLKISFIDNGHGISSDNLSNIFDPFYTTKDPGKGTGLGLSVSFMIIESLGGTIKADSALDEGTTMTILLPLSQQG
jgi:signal transduction histidine kinase